MCQERRLQSEEVRLCLEGTLSQACVRRGSCNGGSRGCDQGEHKSLWDSRTVPSTGQIMKGNGVGEGWQEKKCGRSSEGKAGAGQGCGVCSGGEECSRETRACANARETRACANTSAGGETSCFQGVKQLAHRISSYKLLLNQIALICACASGFFLSFFVL